MKKAAIFILTLALLAGLSPSIAAQNEDRPAAIQERVGANEVRVNQEARAITESFQETREIRVQEMEERRIHAEAITVQSRERQAEQIRIREEEFRSRIQEIADEARRGRAERLAENINNVNERLSSRYDGYLNAMELVLDKIEIRIARIEDAINSDLSGAYVLIDEFREAIADARDKILDQRAKIYFVEIGSENTITDDFRATMEEMRNDHEILKTETIFPLRGMIGSIMTMIEREVMGNDQN